ncbi:MAG: thioredoxin-disulfide reductase, partial [Dehalococcoidia bacterium]
PGGLTAGLYAIRAGLKTLLLEKSMYGGQIVNSQHVENYPGFPNGISGFELASLMQQQAENYGLEMATQEVTGVKAGNTHTVITPDNEYETDVVIIASGSEYSKLGVPGEEKYIGKGVSYCATCDGFLFREKDVAVVGGGDTAITDALELGQHVSNVYVIHRRDQLRAGKVLQERAFDHPKIQFKWDSVVEQIDGDALVKEIKLRNVKTNESSSLPVSGIFVAVGLHPNTGPFKDIVAVNENGQIVVDESMKTSVQGIYAAGDIRAYSARQVSTAVGDGAAAAMAAFKYIKEK